MELVKNGAGENGLEEEKSGDQVEGRAPKRVRVPDVVEACIVKLDLDTDSNKYCFY